MATQVQQRKSPQVQVNEELALGGLAGTIVALIALTSNHIITNRPIPTTRSLAALAVGAYVGAHGNIMYNLVKDMLNDKKLWPT